MKQLSNKNRKALKNKMAQVFSDRITMLSTDMQYILLDDLVTAFENRLEVLNQAQPNLQCITDIGVKASL